ncbi:MAG: helix-turn-helix transcriptional regulator [Minisyncoccia bacterium]
MLKVENFAKLICEARKKSGKTRKAVCIKLGIKEYGLANWERAISFPKETKLPELAVVLELDFQLLKEVWSISKKAREKEIEAKRPPKIKLKKPGLKGLDAYFHPYTTSNGRRFRSKSTTK